MNYFMTRRCNEHHVNPHARPCASGLFIGRVNISTSFYAGKFSRADGSTDVDFAIALPGFHLHKNKITFLTTYNIDLSRNNFVVSFENFIPAAHEHMGAQCLPKFPAHGANHAQPVIKISHRPCWARLIGSAHLPHCSLIRARGNLKEIQKNSGRSPASFM